MPRINAEDESRLRDTASYAVSRCLTFNVDENRAYRATDFRRKIPLKTRADTVHGRELS